MTAPICCEVGEGLEPVRNTVVDLLLVRVGFSIRLADTLGDDAGVALRVTCVFAVLTLHSRRVFEEIAAKSTTHDVVELPLYELVAVHLVNLFFSLTDGALSVETEIERMTILGLSTEI